MCWGLSERGVELICPVLDLDMGKPQLAGAMIKAGQELGCDKARCAAGSSRRGAAAMVRCEKNSEKLGAQILDELKPEDQGARSDYKKLRRVRPGFKYGNSRGNVKERVQSVDTFPSERT